uniref:Cholesteryl ester transfer protein n=1 Tax=Gopherus evgoodei TaxID=1825980 RepID=A0A8C4Y1H7_9SAUR
TRSSQHFTMKLMGADACMDGCQGPSKTAWLLMLLTRGADLILKLNQQTAQVIQAAFRHATYPDISGEKSMAFLGKVAYGLTNIQINDLSIENSEVDFKEDDAIDIAIQNVTASFKGTLSYGYTGAWFVKLTHSIDFEIESSIDLQINAKLTCAKGWVAADTSDCYLIFHKLTLHLQGDKQPGWLKQLFTDFISFTLKLVLKGQVCNEINSLAQLLADFIQDRAANFLQDGPIGVDISLASFPVIKANYMESHHKVKGQYRSLQLLFYSVNVFDFQDDRSLRHFLQKIISVAGIPEVISRIEPALTSLMNSKGLNLFEIKNPEIITKEGYLIIQLDFDFPHHLLVDFLKKTL